MSQGSELGQKSGTQKRIALEDLAFYFDAQERDRLDFGQLGRRRGQILMLREKLLKIPTEVFDQTIQSIEALVKSQSETSDGNIKTPNLTSKERQKNALTLFENTRDKSMDSEARMDQA